MKVLVADDDPISVLYLQDVLSEWGYEVVVAADGLSAEAILLQADGPLLAVLDWMMPGLDGTDVCHNIRQAGLERYVYMIMLTSRTETEFIVAAMNAGADDYVAKPFIAEEMRVRLRAGRRIVDLEQELRRQATRDALTGIFNRGAILDVLQKEIARRVRTPDFLSVIFADLDHFKRINDTYGHLAGDEVLREAARRMAATLRNYDSFGRYGGEELLAVLPDCDPEGALIVAERMRGAMADATVPTAYGDVAVTVSIGIASVNHADAVEMSDLLHRADGALYAAKLRGRNCVSVATTDGRAGPASGVAGGPDAWQS
ncbi:GGDEF domain-containing protein [Massilia antarctica]|uniref:GGDEF domain-containing protein n=1 Tax=Massilia antarctica TaxID=2765360 RepID=UPI0006BB8861|nr:diguanylate cyclase [Massilia sp. H27-R4]MCY0914183.1 diguanylate cyclase [Massilia sp. H27-R4]CUI08585.1 diguanylate cyclase/phosphodiesterase (GGDEF & EAL domains) with PAS/PAC sensor(s) [Janthinobacterium sp. CG23_2]CUU32371.1 diguanylate cyclase/phosphodiesterase (GGDEF & EAL domains) with PAS/PAC sensor(s) [Janthinobacterium sp. CG23_2]